jgi:DNA modification methylase
VIYRGDALDVMRTLPSESVDSVVTDPPAGIAFMSKHWDRDKGGRTQWVEWMTEVMRECHRLLVPGGYALVWSLPRTCHWTAWAMEDAGFIIRDQIAHVFASGFPKGKAQLKPAREDWWLARKPGPLRMLNIDECRIGVTADEPNKRGDRGLGRSAGGFYGEGDAFNKRDEDRIEEYQQHAGRWPANVILTDPIFDGGIEGVVGGGQSSVLGHYRDLERTEERDSMFLGKTQPRVGEKAKYAGDSGTSRFFLIPKADRADREPVVRGSVEPGTPGYHNTSGRHITRGYEERPKRENVHPTVKPTDLMRHLVRLVTPPGGVVLDPFLGSGSTAIACELEGFEWIGIEKEAEYVAIAEARLNGTQRGLGLDVPAPTKKRTSIPFEDRSERAQQQIIQGHTPQRYQRFKEQDGRKPKEDAA